MNERCIDFTLFCLVTVTTCAAMLNASVVKSQTFVPITTGAIATDTTNTNGASWIDFDNDGDLDLFLSNANIPFGFNVLYRNDGDDSFVRIKEGEVTNLQAPSFGNAWADYDNDGLIDLFVVNAFTNLGSLMYRNLNGGKFQRNESFDIGINAIKGFNAAWGDYDNDGLVDLVITHPARFVGMPITSNFLFHNEGGPNGAKFTKITDGAIVNDKGISLANVWGDFDNDGDLDVYVGNDGGRGEQNRYYRNNRDGTFTSIQTGHFVEDSSNTWGVCVGDYANDGDLDLFVANKQGYVRGAGDVNFLYRNDLTGTNNWVLIKCVGEQSNKSAIGAPRFGSRPKLTESRSPSFGKLGA